MSELLNNLASYGVDIKATLACFVDDEALYVHCLEMFFQGQEFAQLDAAMGQKNYVAAFESAHTIKGLTGNLGLTPLFKKVCDFVESLRRNNLENIDSIYKDIVAEHKKLTEIWQKNSQ